MIVAFGWICAVLPCGAAAAVPSPEAFATLCGNPEGIFNAIVTMTASELDQYEIMLPAIPEATSCRGYFGLPLRAFVAVGIGLQRLELKQPEKGRRLLQAFLPRTTHYVQTVVADPTVRALNTGLLLEVTVAWPELASVAGSSRVAIEAIARYYDPTVCARYLLPIPERTGTAELHCAEPLLTAIRSPGASRVSREVVVALAEKFGTMASKALLDGTTKPSMISAWAYSLRDVLEALSLSATEATRNGSSRVDHSLRGPVDPVDENQKSSQLCVNQLIAADRSTTLSQGSKTSVIVNTLALCIEYLDDRSNDFLATKMEHHLFSDDLSALDVYVVLSVLVQYLKEDRWPLRTPVDDARAWMVRHSTYKVDGPSSALDRWLMACQAIEVATALYGYGSREVATVADRVLPEIEELAVSTSADAQPLATPARFLAAELRADQIGRQFADGGVSSAYGAYETQRNELQRLRDEIGGLTQASPPIFGATLGPSLVRAAEIYSSILERMQKTAEALALVSDTLNAVEALPKTAAFHRELAALYERGMLLANQLGDKAFTTTYADHRQQEDLRGGTRVTFAEAIKLLFGAIGQGNIPLAKAIFKHQIADAKMTSISENAMLEDMRGLFRAYFERVDKIAEALKERPEVERRVAFSQEFFDGEFGSEFISLGLEAYFSEEGTLRPVVRVDELGDLLRMCARRSDVIETVCPFLAREFVVNVAALYGHLDVAGSDVDRSFADSNNERLEVAFEILLKAGDIVDAELATDLRHVSEFLDFVGRTRGTGVQVSGPVASPAERAAVGRIQTIAREMSEIDHQLGNPREVEPSRRLALHDRLSERRVALRAAIDALRASRITPTVALREAEAAGDEPVGTATWRTVVFPTELVSVVSTANGRRVFRVPIERSAFRELVIRATRSLRTQQQPDQETLALIAGALLTPVQEFLIAGHVRELHFVPDDVLKAFPLEILPLGSGRLVDQFTVEWKGVGSAGPRGSRASSSGAALFGVTEALNGLPGLPAVRSELAEIAGLVAQSEPRGSVQIFLDHRFSRRALTQALSASPGMLHIASHYVLTTLDAGGGQLLLGDGTFATAAALWQDLPRLESVQSVVLSGCDTSAVRQFSDAQYVDGLNNIFLSKGAKFVLGTLWPVSDAASADFMSVYYSFQLVSNQTPAEALRNAKLVFINGGFSGDAPANLASDVGLASRVVQYHSAWYWAGYQLSSGESREESASRSH